MLSSGGDLDAGQVTSSLVQPFGEHFLVPRDVQTLNTLEVEPDANTCNPSNQKAGAEGRQQVRSQPGLPSKC